MSSMDLNLMTEILADQSESEIKYLYDSIQNVSEKVTLLKLDVKEKMDKKLQAYLPIHIDYGNLLSKGNDLSQDINELRQRLDTQTKRDVEDLTEELKTLKDNLIESSTIVEVLEKLCQMNLEFEKAKKQAHLHDYHEAAKHINTAIKLLNEDCKDLDFLYVYKGLTQTVSHYEADYCRESIEEWGKSIAWKCIDGELNSKTIYASLQISVDKNNFEKLLKTLEMLDVSDKQISVFCNNLLKKILTPIIRMESVVSAKKNGLSVQELSVSSSLDSDKPKYKEVLENLTVVFQYLDQTLGVPMHKSSFMMKVGEFIADDFLNILIDECLSDAIPLRRDPVKNYASIVEPITDFRSQLVSVGFLPESNKALEDYFGNVEMLFLNKRIEKYSDMARSLMKRDLHELVEVGDEPLQPKELKVERTQEVDSISLENVTVEVNKLCPNLFRFPKCCISKSVEEFLNLVNEIITEGNESDTETCVKLLHLARDTILLYQGVVPMYHSKLLHDIPQYSALLHNNLLYLAHQTLTMDYYKKAQNCNAPEISCFADLILPLRKEAFHVLGEQISRQQKILLNILKESGLSALSEYEELPDCTEKSIRGCLRQLSLLKTVWENVLPANIYCQEMGGLCTVVIDEITNRIVATSDIRADIATSLVNVLSLIETQAPQLFPKPEDSIVHVKSWSKLKELILVLGSSLAEVGERWADGKGPLASEFTADQVRQMIKALYQVSKRRAAVLARIK